MKLRFKFFVMRLQVFHRLIHPASRTRSSVQALEHPTYPFDARITQQPVIADHVRHKALDPFRQEIVTLVQQVIETHRVILQGYIGVQFPVLCQEMIVIDIYNDPAIVAMSGMKPFAAASGNGMGIRKGIYGPVQQDSFLYGFRIARICLSPYMICNEIPQGKVLISERKINVGEEIQVFRVYGELKYKIVR